MGSLHYEDLAILHPKNLLTRLMVRTIYDTRYPMEVLPDVVSSLDSAEYPIFSSTNTSGLSERLQGSPANVTSGALSRATIKAIEYAEKMPILEKDSQLLVNIRNEIVDTLSNLFILRKQELKFKYVANNGATRSGAANTEANTYTGTGIQGTNPTAFDGYYKTLDATTEWNDATNGDPFADLGAAKRRVQEETKFQAAWAVWSSRVSEVLIGRPDIQKILADNNNLASAAQGGVMNMIHGLKVAEVDLIEKQDETGVETALNRDEVQVTIEGSGLGLTHVSERENFVVIDKLDELRAIEIELRTKFVPHVQRFRGAFTLGSVVDN